ncbi:glycosyltransferase family 2 protein [Citrobacter werkmanii]|uniref:glycosyltransferase family 2 protein n=1 Tax=Citrobacter werkmanii TaxID=67827 RepID=UPI00264C67E5|nr:glycosyltransferase [Citrobacter werkmanii]MDN8555949.1 glycosyltransferase [Citrobacter werkmanii]
MLTPTEAKILARWSSDEPVRVSICCITYKQQQYIAQAIDSFLMQETAFPFEIIIGEDNGCDGTLAILAEYKKRYPKIINVLTSDKNIGMNANLLRVFNAAKGAYIALCEGDDYWIDKHKLTIQYHEMLKHPEVDFSFHKSACVLDGKEVKVLSQGDKIRVFTSEDMFEHIGMIAATSSYMFSKEIINKLPQWFSKAEVGDFFLEVYGMKDAGGLYIPDKMSVYRTSAINSWSSQINRFERYITIFNKLIENFNWCRNDFPGDLIDRRIAKICIMVATRCLLENENELFSYYVNKATSTYKYVSRKHFVYNLLINHCGLLKFIHKSIRVKTLT